MVLKFIKILKPDYIIEDGDRLNGKSVSFHLKDLYTTPTLKEEFKVGKQVTEQINEAAPKAKKVLVKGNHDFWVVKYTWQHPELVGIIDYNKELGLDDWEVIEYGGSFEFRDFIFTHGLKARSASGYTANAMVSCFGRSGMSGHTHRLGSSYRTFYDSTHGWWENGCLCDFALSEEWFHEPNPNWQHGFSIIKFFDKYKFHVDQIPIPEQDKFIFYNNRYYTL